MSVMAPESFVVTEPGVYYDLSHEDYLRQTDWLSASGLKKLMPPYTPAHFKAWLGAPEEHKRTFDLGKVVHRLVLGEGEDFVVVQSKRKDGTYGDAATYELVSAQAHRDQIYADGKVPILRAELDQAEVMAASIRQHPEASALLSNGHPEVSLFWIDEATGVKCRARLDWLPDPTPGRRLLVPDVKTARSANPREFSKQSGNLRYFVQWWHYLDGIKACGLDDDPAFLFVVVENSEPFLSMVGQYRKQEDRDLARLAVERARRLYRHCLEADHWPGYPGGVVDLALPTFTHYEFEDYIA